MTSRLSQNISERLTGWRERELRVSQFDYEMTMMNVDPYVGYEMTLALDNYIVGIFEASILLCGLALEEQLSLVYEKVTAKAPNKRFLNKNGPVDVQDMKFSMLIDWAKGDGIIDSSWGDDAQTLEEIAAARNLFAHANTIMADKMRKKVRSGFFKHLAPKQVNLGGLLITTPELGFLRTEEATYNTIRHGSSILRRLHIYAGSI